jgi:lactate permease
MNYLSVLLTLLPVGIIFYMLIWRRSPADTAGTVGWVLTLLVAWLFFSTPLSIALRISFAGVVASLPITLMVAASLFQVALMKETGAIDRIVSLIKTVAPSDQVVQIMIVNVGFGTLLAALGATPVSILPPIMLALGYSSFIAIALPALGYDALCTYALLGIPVVVFSGFVGLPVDEVGWYFARFMPIVSTCIAIGMLWIVGRWTLVLRGLVPTLIAGLTAGFIAIGMNAVRLIPLTGVAAGLGVILAELVYLAVSRKPLWNRSNLTEADWIAERRMSLAAAFSPWIILTIFAVVVNAPFLPFYHLTFVQLAMPVDIIPNAPEKVRLFWQAYFWIVISTALAFPFLKPTRTQLSTALEKWLRRAPRPMLASAVFFAMAYLINHSGKGLDWMLTDPGNNMVQILASAASGLFGSLYPVVSPFLGLLGGFISGSEASAIAMLTAIHLSTAEKIGAAGLLLAAASGIGAGLASVISPAKLQNASASIDRIGEEGQVLRVTFVVSAAITLVVAALTLWWTFTGG